MRVIIAAGGTGGHIYPGISIAHEFKRRSPDNEILFVGTRRGLESRIVPREGFALEFIRVGALKSVSALERLRSLSQLPVSFASAVKIIRRFKPDVVIGVGGYSSGPTLLTAALLRIPAMVVEPNAMPGFTNRILARFVRAAALTFEESQRYFRGRGVVTGNPIRSSFGLLKRKTRGERTNILIFGGSQGAHAINEAVIGALPLLRSKSGFISLIHQTGESDFESVRREYDVQGFDADVRPFIDDMAAVFEQADLLVCRSGATTVAEVAAAGKAAIFIPFPFAADDHQRKNAEAFEKAGAARMILQRELTSARLANEISRLLEHPEEIDRMEEASRKLAKAEATSTTVDLAIKIAAGAADQAAGSK